MNAFFLILETRQGCILSFLKVRVKVSQLCWTLCEPTYCNLPGSSLCGILQTRILEWVFPTQKSNPCLPHCRQILYHLSHQRSPRILEWEAYPFSSRSSWPRETKRGLPHCRQILYQLSHKGSPFSVGRRGIMLCPIYHASVHLQFGQAFMVPWWLVFKSFRDERKQKALQKKYVL